MRILVANKFDRVVGGVERHVEDVTTWLRSNGHEVVTLTMSSEPGSARADQVPYVDFRSRTFDGRYKAIKRAVWSRDSRSVLRRFMTRKQIDGAYVAHVYHQIGTVVLNDLRDAGVPTVLSIHDYKVACPNYRFFSERTSSICTKCLDHRLGYLWAPTATGCWAGSRSAGMMLTAEALATRLRGSYKAVGAITTLNSLQERALVRAGVSSGRWVRVPHPVNLQPARDRVRRDHVLVVSRLAPEKGVDFAVRAAARANVPLRIVGDGRERFELQRLAESIQAPVTFVGTLDAAGVENEMRSAAALVVPSRWHEVSPLVCLEAIALDVPVIATSLGGMIDQLSDGRGVLVTPDDLSHLARALRSAVEDFHEMAAISRAARDFAAKHWTPERWDLALREAFGKAGLLL